MALKRDLEEVSSKSNLETSLKRDLETSSSGDDDFEDELSFTPGQYEDSSDSSEEEKEETIQVAFDFSDPSSLHYSSLKQFMSMYLPLDCFPATEMADLIIEQVSVGTMIGVENEKEVYGFITALNITHYQNKISMSMITDYLKQHCPQEHRDELNTMLTSKKTALILNERMVNLPYQLVPPLHEALHQDINWAISNGDTETRHQFDIDTFIFISTIRYETGKKAGGQKRGKCDPIGSYHNFEDEFLKEVSEFHYKIDKPHCASELVTGIRREHVVMVVKKEAHLACIQQFGGMVNL